MLLSNLCDELTVALRNNENVEISKVIDFLTMVEEEKQVNVIKLS